MDLVHSDEIAAGIRTRHIQTPMGRALTLSAVDSQRSAAALLMEAGFDSAPVLDRGSVIGFVSAADLGPASKDGLVAVTRAITARNVVSGDTALGILMPELVATPFLFVVDGTHISGLVTPADINKQPGRAYFYLLLTALELSLAQCIRVHFSSEEPLLELLSEERRRHTMERWVNQQREGVNTDFVAALDFVDLFKIVRKTDNLRDQYGSYTRTTWSDEVCTPVEKLRNRVMHTVRALVTGELGSLDRLVKLDQLLRQLLK